MSAILTFGTCKIRAYSSLHMLVLVARDLIDDLRVSQMYRERLEAGGGPLQAHYATQHRYYARRRLEELLAHEFKASVVEPAEIIAELLSADLQHWDAAVIAACLVDPDAAREAL